MTRSGVSVTNPIGYYIAIPLDLGLVPLGTVIVALVYAKRLRVLADRKAADMVSATVFIATLQKIMDSKVQRVAIEEGSLDDLCLYHSCQVCTPEYRNCDLIREVHVLIQLLLLLRRRV